MTPRRVWAGLWVMATVGCPAPKLPPVSETAPRTVDIVPARAREHVVWAQLALDAHDPERALAMARRASLLDSSAATPKVLEALALQAIGRTDEARASAARAVALEPEVAEVRLVRLSLDGQNALAVDDLNVLAVADPSRWSAEQLLLVDALAAAHDHRAALATVGAEARRRARSAPLADLPVLLPAMAREGGALAVVVAALRLHRKGLADDETQRLARAAAAEAVGPHPAWSPLPPDWRGTISADAPVPMVGYERAPDNDLGWQSALAGQHTDAMAQLTVAFSKHPKHLTVREQLWLVQRAETAW